MTTPGAEAVIALVSGGYAPLTAMVLASRGLTDPRQANAYLSCTGQLHDPLLMKDMDLAAGRLRLAMTRGEKIAVFGDYDVDGITATCLLTDFIRSHGGDCIPYIPGRLEEGYGLNPIALRQLAAVGVKLIVTVDCGITAVEEARLCRALGVDLVITDHHACKQVLPEAVAVVNPHRPDDRYPHKELSGVGVAFKLASALSGNQQDVLRNYADMVCLGTIADVMPLQEENRLFVAKGLESLRATQRPGIDALIRQCGCETHSINASTVGYILAPRINAAGRMGQIDLAVELFLTQDSKKAEVLASALCELNRQRQNVESEIYKQAINMLPADTMPEAIVLSDETWHQGVVGIVASRLAEEYCCPVFLICLDGEHGKASSRSFGGFNLFTALSCLSDLLESYGGHELAAGFTIHRNQIPAFRQQICALAQAYYTDGTPRTVLDADCTVSPELLTLANVDALNSLEPCGNGCPKPVLIMEGLEIERLQQVGGGRHLRLRLRKGKYAFQAIYFSATPESASIAQGDAVDVAFVPQINEYRSDRTVQLNILDIRPSCTAPCSGDTAPYQALQNGALDGPTAELLLPDRQTLSIVWRYLSAAGAYIQESPMCLCRKIVRWSGTELSLGKLMTCLDIFADVGLLQAQRQHKYIIIRPAQNAQKADLNQSRTLQQLLAAKES